MCYFLPARGYTPSSPSKTSPFQVKKSFFQGLASRLMGTLGADTVLVEGKRVHTEENVRRQLFLP